MRIHILLVCLLSTFIYSSCSEEPVESVEPITPIECEEGFIAFNFDINFSQVLDHPTTDSSTHVKVYYEDYYDTGNMKSFGLFPLPLNKEFILEDCLPVSNHPIDSLILGFALIQNNTDTYNHQPIFSTIFLKKDQVNEIKINATSKDLWDRPACNKELEIVFQNLEDYVEDEPNSVMAVAGGLGIALQSNSLDFEKLDKQCKSLIEYYQGGYCPCSKCYVRIYN